MMVGLAEDVRRRAVILKAECGAWLAGPNGDGSTNEGQSRGHTANVERALENAMEAAITTEDVRRGPHDARERNALRAAGSMLDTAQAAFASDERNGFTGPGRFRAVWLAGIAAGGLEAAAVVLGARP